MIMMIIIIKLTVIIRMIIRKIIIIVIMIVIVIIEIEIIIIIIMIKKQTMAAAAASSTMAGLDVTTSSFVTGALRELSIALVSGNEVVYREASHVYATTGGTAARAGAMVPTVDPEYY
jgi:hypothetical protein